LNIVFENLDQIIFYYILMEACIMGQKYQMVWVDWCRWVWSWPAWLSV